MPQTAGLVTGTSGPVFVIDAVADHLRRFPAADDGTIFTTRQRTPFRHDWYGSIIFKKAVRAAGLPESTTSHSLRHTYASLLLAAGESVVTVANRLGHANPNITLSTYAHLIENQDDRTRKALEAAWERSSVHLRSQDR